jgi:two-component system CheB/CheR fusion protein
VVENAREYAIFSMTLDRVILSWNSGARHILGYTAEEAIGRSADLVFTPEDVAARAPETEARTAVAEGRAADERWHVRKDGTRFWGSGVMTAMHDERGEAIGLLKIFRDQTEQMEAQAALEQSRRELWEALQETERARAQAEAAGKAKDHFLAVLSHELRTPLTPVLMATRVLTRDQTLSPAARESLAMIDRNIRMESRFIEDLLDLTRIAHGKLEIVRAPVALHEVVRHAVEVAQPDVEAKEQRVELALEASEDRLLGDATRLQQVFWNLLKNASKFAPAGTAIRVRSRNEAGPPGEPGAICVDVSDEGIGFDTEAAERIFDAFAQASQEITREFGGLGLGLSISRASILAHGGTIHASSPGRNEGATFTVKLSVMKEAAA